MQKFRNYVCSVFTLKYILEKRKKKHSSALPILHRDELCTALESYNVSKNLIYVIKSIYKNTTICKNFNP
jgi:hypothetical protein